MNDKIKSILTGKNSDFDDVTYDTMNMYHLDAWEEMTKGIWFKKIFTATGLNMFLCKMDKGTSYGKHIHSDCDEVLKIYQGVMHDLTTGKSFGRHEVIKYTRKVPHQPMAKTDVLMTVSFYQESFY